MSTFEGQPTQQKIGESKTEKNSKKNNLQQMQAKQKRPCIEQIKAWKGPAPRAEDNDLSDPARSTKFKRP